MSCQGSWHLHVATGVLQSQGPRHLHVAMGYHRGRCFSLWHLHIMMGMLHNVFLSKVLVGLRVWGGLCRRWEGIQQCLASSHLQGITLVLLKVQEIQMNISRAFSSLLRYVVITKSIQFFLYVLCEPMKDKWTSLAPIRCLFPSFFKIKNIYVS